MKIKITMTVDDEFADHDHKMGVTEAAYESITDSLEHLGTNIEVSRDE